MCSFRRHLYFRRAGKFKLWRDQSWTLLSGLISVSYRSYSDHFAGKRFNNDVYYCQSQGLLDSKLLERISSNDKVGEIVMAPSFLLQELWSQG